jgi:hypothetical protein
MAGRKRVIKRIVSHVCLDDLDGPRWLSRAIQRYAEPPIREIRVQRHGLLELGYGLLMLALEGQHVC